MSEENPNPNVDKDRDDPTRTSAGYCMLFYFLDNLPIALVLHSKIPAVENNDADLTTELDAYMQARNEANQNIATIPKSYGPLETSR